MFSIDTDAHATGQLDFMKFGVFQARRAGLTKDEVWNTRGFADFDNWRRGKRARGAVPTPAPGKPKAAKAKAAKAKATPAKPPGRSRRKG